MSGTFTDPEDLSALFSQAESLQEKYEETGRRCVARNGDMLKYMGTPATVRDMVAMADALDGRESPVNYYGFSYGTLLGNLFLNSKNDCPPCQDLRLTCLLQCSLRFDLHRHCLALFLTCIPASWPRYPRQCCGPSYLATDRYISGQSCLTALIHAIYAVW